MARKKKERKGYFYEKEEQYVKDYISAETAEEKSEIFENLRYPITKMVESIIRRYNLYVPDEEFEDTFNDTMSFLMTKIEYFKPEKGCKAYSYCGTICKNYLIMRLSKFSKNQKRNVSYEDMKDGLNDDENYCYYTDSKYTDSIGYLISCAAEKINDIVKRKEEYKLNENEIKVGLALANLLENWEDFFDKMGSDKFNKSSILLFLQETTFLTTKEIRSGMKKYKSAYLDIKKKIADDIY